jgi:hypothetical protein
MNVTVFRVCLPQSRVQYAPRCASKVLPKEITRGPDVSLSKTIRWLAGCYLCLCISGCLGWFEGTSQSIGYVLDKGDAKAIGEWTMKQTDARKIFDGFCALSYRMTTTHNNDEAEDAITWYLLVVGRVEDWPPDQVLPASSGEHWTTRDLIRQAFSEAEHNGVYADDLLHRLRPNEKHGQWLGEWEKSVADLTGWRQEAQDGAAGKRRTPATTQQGYP